MLSKNTKKSKSKKAKKLDYININAAGIDIGSKSHFVAIPEGRDDQTVREFPTFTNSLMEAIHWLKKTGITTVAMEATGVYWIPIYDMLEEHGFEVLLVNARHIKNVPGRKTDVMDCQWIQQLHSYGLLRGSFRPKDKILQMRTFMRQRSTLIQYQSSHILHIQKALSLMNLQLKNVIRDITGMTGMAIVRAIVAGERDPAVLAKYRDPKCKNPEEVIRESLIGNYQDDHLFCLTQAVELYDFYAKKIIDCDQKIEKIMKEMESVSDKEDKVSNQQEKITKNRGKLKPHTKKHAYSFDMHEQLIKITGVDLTAIPGLSVQTVAKIISEIGIDMSKWETSKQFAAWLGLCPGNKVSGGKRLSGKTAPCANKAATALRLAANALRFTDTALGAFFRRLCSRLGNAKAVTAGAHKLAVILYNMLKTGKEYIESGAGYYEEAYQSRCLRNLRHRAQEFGYVLIPINLA
jgi:transposase